MASIAGAILVLAGVTAMSSNRDEGLGIVLLIVGFLYLIVGIANRFMHFIAKTPKD